MKALRASRWPWRIAALVALGVVFAWYLQPDLVMQLATQLWNCF
jgi:hypothetical protein